MSDIKLPQMPEPDGFITDGPFDKPVVIDVYCDSTMEAYAREAVRLNASQSEPSGGDALTAQPAVGEEIMVNAAHDVYTLPLQPSGLSSGPRFVVHVPAPEQQPAAEAQGGEVGQQPDWEAAPPGATHYQPHQGAYYKRVSALEWYVWGRIKDREMMRWLPSIGTSDNAEWVVRPAASAEPVAWVAADTLHSPHPRCVSSLAYVSQIDQDRGREYVPLYAAPPAQPAAGVVDDTRRIRALADNYWRLEPFAMPTPGGDDADVGWRVIEFHRAEPRERVVVEHYRDNPREAIDAAIHLISKEGEQ